MAADDAAGLVRAHAAAIAACLRALAAPGPEPPLLSYDEQTHRFGPAASGGAALSRAPPGRPLFAATKTPMWSSGVSRCTA